MIPPGLGGGVGIGATSAGFFHTQFRVVKMGSGSWRFDTMRYPKWRAAVCGRAGPGGRFLAVLRQVESSLHPRGINFTIRRSERLERKKEAKGGLWEKTTSS